MSKKKKKIKLGTLVCSNCGGSNVQIKAWVDANTHEVIEIIGSDGDKEDNWCSDCESHVHLTTN